MHDQLREAVYSMDQRSFVEHNQQQLKRAVQEYLRHKDAEYDRILKRRRLIESYKETSETQRREKILQQQEEQLKREEQRRAEEIRRLEEQNKENERKRAQAERVSIRYLKSLILISRMKSPNVRRPTNCVASNKIRCTSKLLKSVAKKSS